MDLLTINNLQDYCRTCLRNLRTCLFPTSSPQTTATSFGCNLNELPKLFQLVLMLTSLEGIGENVLFPRRLCQLCHDKLMDIHNFQKLAIQSTNMLSNLLARELQSNNDTEDDNKLVLPEMLPLPPVKLELEEEEAAATEERHEESDDADDEEHSLRSGVANNSSHTTTTARKRERNKKSLKCPRCEKHVYKQVYLDAHIRSVHEGYEKPFLCDACEKPFTRYNQLREHYTAIHELKKQLMCTIQGCNTSFQSANSLQDHIKVMHTIEIGLKEMLNVQNKELKDLENICVQCSRQYSSKRSLAEHLKRHAQIKKYKCHICGVAKVTRTEVRTHMRIHQPDAEKFKCSMCPQEFNHKNAISRHVRVVHEGLRTFACSFCPKRFGTKNAQTYHERLHTGERPFSCEICGKSFAKADGLKSHMKTHDTQLRKFPCSFCERCFITQKNLVEHETRHKGRKPHICELCNLGFMLPEELNTHLQEHKESNKGNEAAEVEK